MDLVRSRHPGTTAGDEGRKKTQKQTQKIRREVGREEKRRKYTHICEQVVGGLDAVIKVCCFDRDRTNQDELIGTFETTLRDILAGHFSAALLNPYKKRY